MQEFHKQQILAAFKRCYGLSACLFKHEADTLSELARQTGIQAKFLSDHIEEIKELAKAN